MAPTPFGNGIYPPCLSARSEEKSNKACRKKKTLKQALKPPDSQKQM